MSTAEPKTEASDNGIAELVRHARLLNINVVNIEATREHTGHLGTLPEPAAPMDVSVRVQTHHPSAPRADANAFLVSIDCSWAEHGAEQPLGRVRIQTRVAYAFDGLAKPPTVEQAAAFATAVAAHQAWPFLRERVMTLALDLQLPPVILPIRRIDEVKAATAADEA